jgi:hypothetical protein
LYFHNIDKLYLNYTCRPWTLKSLIVINLFQGVRTLLGSFHLISTPPPPPPPMDEVSKILTRKKKSSKCRHTTPSEKSDADRLKVSLPIQKYSSIGGSGGGGWSLTGMAPSPDNLIVEYCLH